MQSDATSIADYLAAMPPDRRDAIEAVRATVLEHLPSGYEEELRGMIFYQVPFDVVPKTYNDQPLQYAALANQKRHMALYLSNIDDAFLADYKATGKRMDVGRSCVRFTKLEQLPLELIARQVASVPLADFLTGHEGIR